MKPINLFQVRTALESFANDLWKKDIPDRLKVLKMKNELNMLIKRIQSSEGERRNYV